MALPEIVSAREWDQARGELLKAEKEATRALDAADLHDHGTSSVNIADEVP